MRNSRRRPRGRGFAVARWAAGLLGAAVCGGACAGAPSAPPRSVEPDRPTSAPTARRSGNTADHLVVLRAPHDPDRALDTVFALFSAVRRESRADLLESFTPDAVFRSRSGHNPSLLARVAWTQRFARLDYDELEASAVFRPADIRTYSPEDLTEMAEWASAGPDDLWVVIPIRTPAAGGVRLFGRTITLLLHPTDRGYKIAAQVEDFQLP